MVAIPNRQHIPGKFTFQLSFCLFLISDEKRKSTAGISNRLNRTVWTTRISYELLLKWFKLNQCYRWFTRQNYLKFCIGLEHWDVETFERAFYQNHGSEFRWLHLHRVDDINLISTSKSVRSGKTYRANFYRHTSLRLLKLVILIAHNIPSTSGCLVGWQMLTMLNKPEAS